MSKQQVIKSIINGDNEYFGYSNFAIGNMKDYTLMKCAINDLTAVYGFDQSISAEIVQELTH